MRFSVIHSTVYRYDRPVVLEPHVFRLRPREDGSQRLIDHRLEISPAPRGQAVRLDQDGNVTVEAWFEGMVQDLAVRSAFEVETLRCNPFDFLLSTPDVLALPPSYGDRERAVLEAYLSNSGGVSEFTARIAARSGGQTMPFLETLVRELFETCEHVLRPEGPPHSPADTLRDRRGSCRDFAMLFCAASRAVGIPARFVSGYEKESASHDHAHMHAWAEVYIPGGGWRGYDPSRGVAVSVGHVPVAAAADPAMAAPISGSYRGAAACQMELAISMQVG